MKDDTNYSVVDQMNARRLMNLVQDRMGLADMLEVFPTNKIRHPGFHVRRDLMNDPLLNRFNVEGNMRLRTHSVRRTRRDSVSVRIDSRWGVITATCTRD